MRGFSQLLADMSGRCAAVFLKCQLFFLARERARLERRYSQTASNPRDESSEITATDVVHLLPPPTRRRHGAPARRRTRDYIA
jgi:hypothetical protein